VDVVLDPIHFGGGNSSFEAIAMGTPVVTMAGSFLRSRITSAIYEQMDFPQLISKSLEEYCDIAVRIACDRHYGSAIRKEILSRAALLFDQHSVSKEFENCLLQLGRVTL
jgi:predicted O-linked N-acetylglucosamine transferase (SPINDLY family)